MASAEQMAFRAMRRFSLDYRRRFCPVGKTVTPEEKDNEPWRRISGITVLIENCMDGRERCAGIRRLIVWIEKFVRKDLREARTAAERMRAPLGEYLFETAEDAARFSAWDAGRGLGEGAESCSEMGTSCGTGLRTDADPWHPEQEAAGDGVLSDEQGTGLRTAAEPWHSEEEAAGDGALSDEQGTGLRTAAEPWHPEEEAAGDGVLSDEQGTGLRTAAEPWHSEQATAGEEEVWACEGRSVELVLKVCGTLNISRSKLTTLIQEVRGISATELIDGFRIGAVKRLLAERVRAHARELWMEPGLYAGVLVMDERLRVHGGGRSEYYAEPDAGWRRAELGDTRKERLEQLIRAYDAGWRRGEQARDGFAAALGFRTFGELNRACLNVHGMTARQIAYAICRDVVEFYLAKEMEELRELAGAERVTPAVARARVLYSVAGERPGAGASLLWASQDAGWLRKMGGWLG